MWECIYLRSHFLFFFSPFSVLLNKYTEVRLLDHTVVLFFLFFLILRTSVLRFTIHQKYTGVLTSPHPCQRLLFFCVFCVWFLSSVIFLCFGNSHPNKYKVILLWLWFPSPWLLVMLGTFYIPVVHLYISFEDMSIEVCCPFLNWITSLFFVIKLEEFLTCLGY